MKRYIDNIKFFFYWHTYAKEFYKFTDKPFWNKVHFELIYFDIFINALTGGDPRETISSSLHKDRKSSWGAGVMINIIETLSSKDHGEKAEQFGVGEGSKDNREINGLGRCVLIFWWVIIVAGIIYVVRL